jgi:hypothetical protein
MDPEFAEIIKIVVIVAVVLVMVIRFFYNTFVKPFLPAPPAGGPPGQARKPDVNTFLDELRRDLGHGDLPDKLERLERVLSALAADGQRAEVLHLDNRRRPDWVAVRLKAAGPRGP